MSFAVINVLKSILIFQSFFKISLILSGLFYFQPVAEQSKDGGDTAAVTLTRGIWILAETAFDCGSIA